MAKEDDVWPYPLWPEGSRKRRPGPPADKPHALPVAQAGHYEHPWGICLSGGGIRSASFCMGALQAMQRRKMLVGEDHATYLSAVSGGSYIAGAYALLARQIKGAVTDPTEHVDPEPPLADIPPFHRGLPVDWKHESVQEGGPPTPEERYLRDHTLYLPHGPGGAPGALWHLVLGISWNLIVLTLVILSVSTPVGWLVGVDYTHHVSLKLENQITTIHTPVWDWWLLLALAVVSLLLGMLALVGVWKPARAAVLEGLSRFLVVATGIWLLVIALPYVLLAIRHLPFVHASDTAQAVAPATGLGAVGGGLGLLTGIGSISRLWSKKVKLPAFVTGALSSFYRSHRTSLLNAAAFVSGVLLVVGASLAAAAYAAGAVQFSEGRMDWDAGVWAVGVLLLVILWAVADLNAWSPHSYYYQRLASVFAVGRTKVDPQDRRLQAKGPVDPSSIVHGPPPEGEAVTVLPWRLDGSPLPELALSTFQANEFPEVLICACATVTDYGAIPTGFNATSFVFSRRHVGGPLVGAVPTKEYEEALGDLTVNLPEAVSLAGAAVAPAMGKMTRAPLRFLLTMANIRLGVWMVNPRRIEDASAKDRTGKSRRTGKPRINYLFREMLGRNHLGAKYLYVSDGGHYENLGLVEQLRRRCEWIVCIDAAGDKVDTFQTLGDAIAIARTELGVDVRIHPAGEMAIIAPDQGAKHQPWVKQAHCMGTIHYPAGDEGYLLYIKAGVPPDAPWDVQSFAVANAGFPTDPTLDQLYTAERLEAYRALGEFVTERALTDTWSAFESWKATRRR